MELHSLFAEHSLELFGYILVHRYGGTEDIAAHAGNIGQFRQSLYRSVLTVGAV